MPEPSDAHDQLASLRDCVCIYLCLALTFDMVFWTLPSLDSSSRGNDIKKMHGLQLEMKSMLEQAAVQDCLQEVRKDMITNIKRPLLYELSKLSSRVGNDPGDFLVKVSPHPGDFLIARACAFCIYS